MSFAPPEISTIREGSQTLTVTEPTSLFELVPGEIAENWMQNIFLEQGNGCYTVTSYYKGTSRPYYTTSIPTASLPLLYIDPLDNETFDRYSDPDPFSRFYPRGIQEEDESIIKAAWEQACEFPPLSNEGICILSMRHNAGDNQAYKRLVSSFARLAFKLAYTKYKELKYMSFPVSFYSLLSESYFALSKAVDAYDIAKGYTLIAFLRKCVENQFSTTIGKGLISKKRQPVIENDYIDRIVIKLVYYYGLPSLRPYRPTEEKALQTIIRNTLWEILTHLPESYLDCVRQKFWDNKTLEEIAQELGVRRQTVSYRVLRALEMLSNWPWIEMLREGAYD